MMMPDSSLKGMEVRVRAYAVGSARAITIRVERLAVAALRRRAKSTSFWRMVPAKAGIPPAAIAQTALPMKKITSSATATVMAENRSVPLCPLCLFCNLISILQPDFLYVP